MNDFNQLKQEACKESMLKVDLFKEEKSRYEALASQNKFNNKFYSPFIKRLEKNIETEEKFCERLTGKFNKMMN